MRLQENRYYLLRDGTPIGPTERWNPILMVAPLAYKHATGDAPPHYTWDMAGCSTWRDDLDIVDELLPRKTIKRARPSMRFALWRAKKE